MLSIPISFISPRAWVVLGGHAYRPLPIPITTATTTGKSIYIGPRIVYQQNYGGYAGHGYAPTTTGTGSTGQVVVTKAVTRTVTNTIIKEVYTRITEKYMPIIEYFTQYLMTWLTPSGMCQNGLCGLNPSYSCRA